MKVMRGLTTAGCDFVNFRLSGRSHVGHTNLITSPSVPSMNPPVGLLVIFGAEVFIDILPPVIVAIVSFDYLLKWPADRVS
jgi:hypothetical protein